MQLLLRWLISALAVLAAAYLVPGIHVAGFTTALFVALILGLLNAVIRPVIWLLTLPLTILTLGLFIFILNGIMLWLAAALVPGIEIQSFFAAVLGSIVISIVSWIGNQLFTGDREEIHE